MQIFHPRISRCLAGLFVLLYGGGLVCLWITALNLGIKLFISVIVVVYGVMIARRHLFLSAKKSIVTLSFDPSGWQFVVNSGKLYQATISPDSVVTRYIMILNFKTLLMQERHTLLLLPDSLSFDELRQLRIKLYWDVG